MTAFYRRGKQTLVSIKAGSEVKCMKFLVQERSHARTFISPEFEHSMSSIKS
jgi:hypothetical protein